MFQFMNITIKVWMNLLYSLLGGLNIRTLQFLQEAEVLLVVRGISNGSFDLSD